MGGSSDAAELNELLNTWDPIGIRPGVSAWPPDEYECLVGPLLTRLRRGDSAESVATFLRSELVDHFGLDPDSSDPDAFAAKVVSWHGSRRGG